MRVVAVAVMAVAAICLVGCRAASLGESSQPPVFVTERYTATVLDSAAVGEAVMQAQAVDAEGDALEYSLLPIHDNLATVSHYFSIDEHTGAVYLQNLLVPTSPTTFDFIIKASGRNNPEGPHANASVTISVERVKTWPNLHWPKFENLVQSIQISEETAPGTIVLRANATDLDGDEIRYGLRPNRDLDVLDINETTGDVFLTKPINITYEDFGDDFFLFLVNASDQREDEGVSRMMVMVFVPETCSETSFICENGSAEFTFFGSAFGNHSCIRSGKQCDGRTDCKNNEDEHGCPCPNDDDFVCESGNTLGRGSCIHESLRCDGNMQCNNGEDEEGCENDHAPKFVLEHYSAEIPEDTAPGTTVLQAHADDKDGDKLKYSLVPNYNADDEALDYLDINADTGHIYLKKPLAKCKEIKDFKFIIHVSDQHRDEKSADTEGELVVLKACEDTSFVCESGSVAGRGSCIDDSQRCDGHTDCNNGEDEEGCEGRNIHAPKFQLENETYWYSAEIAEDAAIGTTVLQARADDLDGDKLKYSLVDFQWIDEDGLAYFDINTKTGDIYLKKRFTECTDHRLYMLVLAQDQRSDEKATIVHVIVDIIKTEN